MRNLKSKNIFKRTNDLGHDIHYGIFDSTEKEQSQIIKYLIEVLEKILVPFKETSNEQMHLTNFKELDSLILKSHISNNYNLLNQIALTSMNIITRSKELAIQAETFRDQLTAIQHTLEEEAKLNAETGEHLVADIVLETEVTVDFDKAYLLYQHYFGYPEDGVWDNDKLKIILEAINETETEHAIQDAATSSEQPDEQTT